MASRYITRFVQNRNGRAQRRRILRASLPRLGDRVLTASEARGLQKARAARGKIRARGRRKIEARASGLERAANYTNLTTWFKAQGTTVSGDNYHGKLPGGLSSGPVRFVSREGLFLGRVRYYGYHSVDDLIALLNSRLRYKDAKGLSIGFQDACVGWAYKWRLYGVPQGGSKSVIIDKVDRKGGIKIRDLFHSDRNDFA